MHNLKIYWSSIYSRFDNLQCTIYFRFNYLQGGSKFFTLHSSFFTLHSSFNDFGCKVIKKYISSQTHISQAVTNISPYFLSTAQLPFCFLLYSELILIMLRSNSCPFLLHSCSNIPSQHLRFSSYSYPFLVMSFLSCCLMFERTTIGQQTNNNRITIGGR